MGLFNSKYVSTIRLEGKTAIVTGANTGIGKMTVQDFFTRGARVVMTCRSIDKGRNTVAEIEEACKSYTNVGQLEVVHLDLSSLESVRNCAKQLLQNEERIDLLVNNAGVMTCPEGKTLDGYETQFGTNHLGHFLFTLLLLPRILRSKPARIINVSSAAHAHGHINFEDLNFEKRRYSAMQAYCQSKLANVLFTNELARRLNEANIEGVTVCSLHPGVVQTELGRHVDSTYFRGLRTILKILTAPFIKTPEQGAQTTIYCAIDKDVENESGMYYDNRRVVEPGLEAKNQANAERLWDVSLKLVGLSDDFDPLRAK